MNNREHIEDFTAGLRIDGRIRIVTQRDGTSIYTGVTGVLKTMQITDNTIRLTVDVPTGGTV